VTVARRVRRAVGRAARRAGLAPPAPVRPRSNGRLAFVGPMPPAPTGIATYHAAVLAGLERIGFLQEHPADVVSTAERPPARPIEEYELGIFQIGNNLEQHGEVFRLAARAPGLLVLHDLALDDFVRGLAASHDPLGAWALDESGRAIDPSTWTGPGLDGPLLAPWCAAAVRAARGVVVHSGFGGRYLRWLGCRTPVFVVPHPVVESAEALARAEVAARAQRAALAARGVRRLVAIPGDVNRTKQHGAILSALARLPADVHAAIVGRPGAGYDVVRLVEHHGVADRVTVRLRVPDDEFLSWILAADVVVDLRFPHRGEVSGSLVRAMQAGRPTIVSATGTYLEVPGDAVVRVAPGPVDPAELHAALRSLLDDEGRRRRIGDAASAYVARLHAADTTATGYRDAILATRELVRDPARLVLSRWARSLAEIGVDEDLLQEGYGVAYARALEGFARPV
jgi:glycosyltransferase involved in cell wall biosynthesis